MSTDTVCSRRLLIGWLFFVTFAAELLAPGSPAGAAARNPAQARNGMVVTSQADATRAGVAMFEAGGNAVDAAVAGAFALSVTQPFSTGIGGGAFALVRTSAGRIFALDARETAPAAADRDMYVREGVPERASLHGPLAVATPGLVRGLAELQEKYGTMPLATVMAPAIALAREGFEISPYHARMLESMKRWGIPERFPETARIQFPADGATAKPGWRLVQSDLADTLEKIARFGPDAFYTGATAWALASHVKAAGGILAAEDLAGYQPKWRKPIRGTYRGHLVTSFPPPSSGGVALVEMLNILEDFDLRSYGAGSSASIHRITEAMKLAFADRANFLGDPDFVDIPTERLVDKLYADKLRARINPPFWRKSPLRWGSEAAITVRGPGRALDDAGTTHLSVTDASGMAVAITKTINTPFGSGITVPGTGVILNNEMDDFSVALDTPNAYGLVDKRGANLVAPGKRPLSSMTPTIVERDGGVFMVSGSPGGPRIISTTLLSILNVIDFEMNVQEAVAAPRFHHQWDPDKLRVEPAIPADVIDALRARGHEVEVSERNWSAAEAIVVDMETRIHLGGNDPRRDGLALGY